MQIELTQTQFGPDASCLLALNKQSPTHRDVFPRGSGPSRPMETADISTLNPTYQWVVEVMYQTNNTEHYHCDYTNPTITEKQISDQLDIWIT